MPGRSYSTPSYRYGFNGVEKDDEINGSGNTLAWAERMYDPRLARWKTVDGGSYFYPALGPYTYCANSPLYIREIDGQFIGTISGYFIGGTISLGKAIYDGKSGKDLAKAWVRGSTTGLVAGAIADITIATAGTGTVALMAAGGLAGVGGSLTNQTIQHYDWGKEISGKEVAIAGGTGVVLGYVGPKVINWAAPKMSTAFVKVFGKTARGQTASVQSEGLTITQFGDRLITPQGLTDAQFTSLSQTVRSAVGNISDDIVVQGSRASGTASATSDIDIAVKVSEAQFESLIKKAFGNPNPGSAKEKTMQNALTNGIIQRGEAGFRTLGKQLEKSLGMEVDVSIIKAGGAFDNGVQIPLKK